MSVVGIRVRFVANVFAAAAASGRAEWPPHPVRLLYAAVDAAGTDASEPEERALRWLAKQPAPSISCPEPFMRAAEPKPFMPYVPPLKRLKELIPLRANDRTAWTLHERKQFKPLRTNDRLFPEAVLPCDREDVVFSFDRLPEAPLEDLDGLLARVRRLGTHRSPCIVDLVEETPRPAWVPTPRHVPDNHPEVRRLRWGYEGIVADLRQGWRKRCDLGPMQAELAREPMPATHIAYVPAGYLPEAQPRPPKGLVATLRLTGDSFTSRHAVHIVAAARTALNHATDGAIPAVHGHAPDGRPAKDEPRVGVIPLIDAGYQWSDGRVLGVGFAVPPALEYDAPLFRGLEALRHRSIRVLGRLASLEAPDDAWTLNPKRWTRPSRRWTTVTPIVNSGFPDGSGARRRPSARSKAAKKALKMLTRAAPDVDVQSLALSPESSMRGIAPAREFTAPERRRWSWRMHMQVVFAEPVAGPLLVGPGRWQGWGLMAPEPKP